MNAVNKHRRRGPAKDVNDQCETQPRLCSIPNEKEWRTTTLFDRLADGDQPSTFVASVQTQALTTAASLPCLLASRETGRGATTEGSYSVKWPPNNTKILQLTDDGLIKADTDTRGVPKKPYTPKQTKLSRRDPTPQKLWQKCIRANTSRQRGLTPRHLRNNTLLGHMFRPTTQRKIETSPYSTPHYQVKEMDLHGN